MWNFFLFKTNFLLKSHFFTCSRSSSSCQGIKLWLIGEGGGWGVRGVGGGRVAGAPRPGPGVEVAAAVGGGKPVAAVARHLLAEPLPWWPASFGQGEKKASSEGTSRGSHEAKYTLGGRLSPTAHPPTELSAACFRRYRQLLTEWPPAQAERRQQQQGHQQLSGRLRAALVCSSLPQLPLSCPLNLAWVRTRGCPQCRPVQCPSKLSSQEGFPQPGYSPTLAISLSFQFINLLLLHNRPFLKGHSGLGYVSTSSLTGNPLSLFFLIVLFLRSAETLTHICAVSSAEKQEDFPQRGHGSPASRGSPRQPVQKFVLSGSTSLCSLLKGDCSHLGCLLSLFCHKLQSRNSQIEEVELSDAVFAAHPGRRLVAHIGVCHPPPSLSHWVTLSPCPEAAFHHWDASVTGDRLLLKNCRTFLQNHHWVGLKALPCCNQQNLKKCPKEGPQKVSQKLSKKCPIKTLLKCYITGSVKPNALGLVVSDSAFVKLEKYICKETKMLSKVLVIFCPVSILVKRLLKIIYFEALINWYFSLDF